MKGKKVRITEEGVKISQGRVVSVNDKNLNPFEQLALVSYPKLYYIDKYGRLKKRKNAGALLQKGNRPDKPRRTKQPDHKHELGSKPVSRTPQERKELHQKRMESADVARTKLDKIRAEMRERYLLKKQAGLHTGESQEAPHPVSKTGEESRRDDIPKENPQDTGTTQLLADTGQAVEGPDENGVQ